MIKEISEVAKIFLHKYLATEESLATLLIVLVILLKLFINRKATAIDFKKTIVSVPSEIISLVVGFLISSMIMISNVEETNPIMAGFIVVLIILVVQYALERWLKDKLSGKLKIKILLCVISMYLLSVFLYIIVVFGGIFKV